MSLVAYIPEYSNIFRTTLKLLDNEALTRRDLIDRILAGYKLTKREMSDLSINGRRFNLRSSIGTVLADMESKGVIAENEDGLFVRTEEQMVAIRMEECEREIIKLVTESPKTKQEIKDGLVSYFGTDSTSTVKDDNRLFTYMGQILKRLVTEDVFDYDGAVYSVVPERTAYIKDRSAMLGLKTAFLTRVHSHGGEFFEHYFLNLLEKYLIHCGKRVTEAYVTGGSDDGGIDCVLKTVDPLGFRETIMVQTKNRVETATETTVRSFYGAVCARQGSRGVFATISDFHPAAAELLDSIDNCVGVNGDKIFSMACDTSYGIVREGARLKIDSGVI